MYSFFNISPCLERSPMAPLVHGCIIFHRWNVPYFNPRLALMPAVSSAQVQS